MVEIIETDRENEYLQCSSCLKSNEDNLLISTRTKGICISAADIPILGRQAAGNKLIKEGKIISIGKI